ncbi:MAG: MarR family transcriptional regulator [Acidobacteriia bacterium]|nr:MarR family transcriptional regulator [Terriglobia bacterium]
MSPCQAAWRILKFVNAVGSSHVRRRAAPATPAGQHRQIREFVDRIDWLSERLTPPRRPQDAQEPECSRTELRILSVLGRKEPVTMTDLAGGLGIPLSTATRAIDKLVAKGLVERRGVPKDRRIVQIGFSRHGREINRFAIKSRCAIARSLLRKMSPAERTRLLQRLVRLAAPE